MTAVPYLALTDAKSAIAFYEAAFGAEFFYSVYADDSDALMHGRLRIAGDVIMVFESGAAAAPGVVPPDTSGGTSVIVRLTVAERSTVDRFAEAAEANGASIKMGPVVAPWGEYYVRMIDPFGHCWAFGAA